MDNNKTLHYIKEVLENMPADWLNLTTHRLDIFNEKLAKVEFLEYFETLFNATLMGFALMETFIFTSFIICYLVYLT